MNFNENSLQLVNNKNILTKILNFFKKISWKNKSSYIISNNNMSNKTNNKNSFYNSIKFEEDLDREKLLKIQEELEKRGINKQNAFNLTKDLSEKQKQKLEELYKEQIHELETNIENYKNKITDIRKKLALKKQIY